MKLDGAGVRHDVAFHEPRCRALAMRGASRAPSALTGSGAGSRSGGHSGSLPSRARSSSRPPSPGIRLMVGGTPTESSKPSSSGLGSNLASLTDRGALDLYGELFVPADRAMGHHVR